MSTVEAAASLFGPEELASDPFAALGTDTDTSQSTNDPFSGHENNPHPQFFNSDTESSFLSHLGEASNELQSDPAALGHYDGFATYSQDLSSANYNYNQAQGWYDERGQHRAHEQSHVETSSTAQQLKNVPSYPAPSNPYDPYAPKFSNASPSHVDVVAAPYSQSQPPYEPYNPSSTHYSLNHVPASSQSSYEPYKPMAASGFPPGPPSYPSASPYVARPTIAPSIPPPPVPAAPLNRPKTLNAYDPPFPTSKPARRGASTRPVQSLPIVGQSTYHAVVSPAVIGGPYGSSHGASYTHDAEGSGTTRSTYRDDWSHSHNNTLSDGQVSLRAHEGENKLPPVELDPSRGDNDIHRTSRQPGDRSWSPHQASSNNSSPRQAAHSGDLHVPATSQPTHQPNGHIGPPAENSLTAGTPGNQFSLSSSWDTHSSTHVSSTSHEFQSPSLVPERATSIGHGFTQPEAENSAWSPKSELIPAKHFSLSGSSVPPVDHYDPKYVGSIQRTSSPASLSDHSRHGSHGSDLYSPLNYNTRQTNFSERKSFSQERTVSPGSGPISLLDGSSNSPYEQVNGTIVTKPYDPTTGIEDRGRVSPGGMSLHSWNDLDSNKTPDKTLTTHDPLPNLGRTRVSPPISFTPRRGSQSTHSVSDLDKARAHQNRSLSNGSAFSTLSAGVEDPYAPHDSFSAIETLGYGNASNYSHPYGQEVGHHKSAPVVYDQSGGQDLLLAPRTQTLYAPSPSLLGSNDPLGRTSARVPVFSFGFGGKLVTCFHGSSVLNTGFDVALSSRKSMDIHIRVLNKIIPQSAMDISTALFPGPLFSDPGTPATSLVRAGSSAQTKTKKARLLKYLEERAAEISQGIGYLPPTSGDRRKAEGKFVLVRLLSVMVENDGRLSGSPQIDMATRAALIPRLSGSLQDSSNAVVSLSFSSADSHTSDPSLPYPSLALSPSESTEMPISVSTLRPSALDNIQEFLLRGERHKAYHYALDEKLWAHAMVIASSIDKEAWKAVVGEFLKHELGIKDITSRGPPYLRGPSTGTSSTQTNGRESLRVAYSLFSGQGATAVQELLPPNSMPRAIGALQTPNMSQVTPMTPSFPSLPVNANVPVESLSRWAETAAMILTNPMTAESSAALTTLGDYLASNQWIEAAHACYLLAPQSSPIGGLANPSSRIVLLGSGNHQVAPSSHKDSDAIIFTEIAEFALSLSTPVKGQEIFNGLPHLQVYKLIRACSLAEMGHVQLANRYCEAITASLGRTSPYFTQAFVQQLKGLADRIVGAPHIDKSGSWIGGKMSKPSLDSIGTWLEGRFTKLIAGDGDADGTPVVDDSSRGPLAFSGPFSHYSTISSATPSASPSPQPSIIDANTFPPRRTGSAMAYPLVHNSHAPIDRASSAVDYIRRRPSPAPRILSANAVTTSFSQSPSFGQAINDYTPTRENNFNTQTPRPSLDSKGENDGGQDVAWWGSSYAQDYSAQTPTATTFMRVDDSTTSDSSSGFMSLMDDAPMSVAPAQTHPHRAGEQEDDEDLGFGNSKAKTQLDNGGQPSPTADKTEPAKAEPQRPDTQGAGSGSWISRWWKKSDTPGPIKASLGEETSFVYDKELKRWVNKKAGSTEPHKPATPPPPPRSQTASPGRSVGTLSNGTSAGPPPTRSASAIDLSSSPPSKNAVRVRSNLVPKSESEHIPPSTPPPPMRPRSQATKRNIRSRYVDVFQEGAQ